MAFRAIITPLTRAVEKELVFIDRMRDKAAVAALNSTNRTVRAKIIRAAQARFSLKNQKTLRRQIRIPRRFRARPGKLVAGGLYDLSLPRRATGDRGRPHVIVKGRSQQLPQFGLFPAKMKSGHEGIFVRAPKDTPGFKRRNAQGGKTWLPIWEVMSDVTAELRGDVEAQVLAAQVVFKKRAEAEFRRRLQQYRGGF